MLIVVFFTVIAKHLNSVLGDSSTDSREKKSDNDLRKEMDSECHSNDAIMQRILKEIKGSLSKGKSRQFAEKLLQVRHIVIPELKM